ncbi:sulfurtransferase [Ramlibacter sp. 2FC]|uniref:sulfurtransferase n=1 Tax=Ramlibacter sp. 2FC TaxID=2502188 RepID=UPI0010F4D962|nr:sulfurtransferase [Ramlibacter sp. 2FC]
MKLPGPLVSTQWLADHLDVSTLRVFDASVYLVPRLDGAGYLTESGRSAWQSAHIPGANFLDLLADFSDNSQPVPVMMPAPERFAALCERHGIGDDVAVVIYSAQGMAWSARMWWMLRAMGFDNAAVLDGGWEQWQCEGRPSANQHQPYPVARLTAKPQAHRWADKTEVLQAIHNPTVCTLNALPAEVYDGRLNRFGRAGHIPGSHHMAHSQLLDPGSGRLLSPELLRLAFDSVGAMPRRVIAYCGTGVAASVNALALAVLGHANTAVYDGSMAEWAMDPVLPLVTGNVPG